MSIVSTPRPRVTWARFLVWGSIVSVLALAFKPVVENDGVYYFTYLRAVVVDHTLNVASLLPHAYQSTADWFPIGSALLSLPAYLVALLIGGAGRGPFDAYYVDAFVLSSLLFGMLALAVCYRIALSASGSSRSAAVGVAAGALTTPFIYYLLYEPSYSHTFSAFAAALFVFFWWRSRERSVAGWLWLGILGGLMADIRFQDGLLMLIALVDLPRARWRVLLMIPAAALAFTPQAIIDLAQWGSLLPQRAVGQGLTPLPGHYLQVLFSSRNGLFVWHPSLLVAAAGIALLRDRRLAAAALLAFVIETAVNGMLPDWAGGFTFGGRRFIALLPFMVIGFASIAERIKPGLAWAATGALTLWNVVLMANLTYVVLTERDPGYAGLLAGQARAAAYVAREFVQGEVVRDLILWPVLKLPFRPITGVGLVVAEALCAGAFVWVAGRARRHLQPAAQAGGLPDGGHPVGTPSLELVDVPAVPLH